MIFRITSALHLKRESRCRIAYPAMSRLECADVAIEDGRPFEIGGIRLDPVYTPGHTDDHFSYRANGRVFTGDALLIGVHGDHERAQPAVPEIHRLRGAGQSRLRRVPRRSRREPPAILRKDGREPARLNAMSIRFNRPATSCDTIVIGSRRERTVARMGSVAQKVIVDARIPVIVI